MHFESVKSFCCSSDTLNLEQDYKCNGSTLFLPSEANANLEYKRKELRVQLGVSMKLKEGWRNLDRGAVSVPAAQNNKGFDYVIFREGVDGKEYLFLFEAKWTGGTDTGNLKDKILEKVLYIQEQQAKFLREFPEDHMVVVFVLCFVLNDNFLQKIKTEIRKGGTHNLQRQKNKTPHRTPFNGRVVMFHKSLMLRSCGPTFAILLDPLFKQQQEEEAETVDEEEAEGEETK
jgi:hypothetical protein